MYKERPPLFLLTWLIVLSFAIEVAWTPVISRYSFGSSNTKYFTALASMRNPCLGLVKIDSG